MPGLTFIVRTLPGCTRTPGAPLRVHALYHSAADSFSLAAGAARTWVWTFLNCLALGILLLLSLIYVRPHLTGVRPVATPSATYLLALPLNVVAQHLIFGQINLLLVSLCLIDMVRPQARYLPRGVLIGLAAGIKLTPALFIFSSG
ncbi:glycosyltransferase family 87 protein [Rothia nasimurium]|uniref:glycosyltransferase family 87 protein n=1 Tax=Rothia nasimurium TaxID=85336 RepID=UPI001430FCCA|nr:glycosyltransferase family 87 protein [Rothia nasimurium]MBF0808033.1 DUF2029 domain-containing protein [Rothia nasimurium]